MAIQIDMSEYQVLLHEILNELKELRKDLKLLLTQQNEQEKNSFSSKQVVEHLTPREVILFDKIRERERITNTEAAELLDLSISRANHLLKSLHRKGWLDREYLNRRVYYIIRSEVPSTTSHEKENDTSVSFEDILETGAIKVTVNAMNRLDSEWLSLEEIAEETNFDKTGLDFQKKVLEALIKGGIGEFDSSKKKYRLVS